MIEVDELSFRFEGAKEMVLQDLSFEINSGEIFGLVGPGGAGKSTVQNVVAGLLPLQQGIVQFEGTSIKTSGKKLYNRIGICFEKPNIYGKLSGLENLRYFAGLFSGKKLTPEKALAMVGLADAMHKRTEEYSEAMKKRLVFARSIINRPDFLFLDEPLAGLDTAAAGNIKEIIRSEKARGAAILLTTHDIHVADELCDTVAFINRGRLVARDSPGNLKRVFGLKAFKGEYRRGKQIVPEIFFPNDKYDREKLELLMAEGRIETLHSQETSLEEVFIRLTGRGLD